MQRTGVGLRNAAEKYAGRFARWRWRRVERIHSRFIAGEANTEPRKKFHLLGRLRKAVKQAELLETLCNQQKACDARTKLEVQVRLFVDCMDVSFTQLRFSAGVHSCDERSLEI